jgi:hypothetical protein
VADCWWWYTKQTGQVEFEFAAGARNKVGIPVQDACPTSNQNPFWCISGHELRVTNSPLAAKHMQCTVFRIP